jgi:hypothetical protein
MLAKNRDDQDSIDALTTKYVTGELTEAVYKASLMRYLNRDDIRFLVMTNGLAHRNSLAFKRGEIRS